MNIFELIRKSSVHLLISFSFSTLYAQSGRHVFLRIFRGDVSTCVFEARQKIAAHRSRYEQAWTRSALSSVAALLE